VSARSPEELERALRELGLRASIEAMDALAVAIPEPDERGFEREDLRARAIALARAHGFSHLAV
jgi:serine/threonine protein kinase HipA of HipAB toxin-antitoxin module